MNELNHINGKGDKDRSPGWRDNYDSINFNRASSRPDGFARRGNRMVKTYTPGRKAVFVVDLPPASKSSFNGDLVDCGGRCNHSEETCPIHTAAWGCTLAKGHMGDHVACGLNEHNLFHWPQVPPGPKCDCRKPGYVSVGECVCEREPVKCNGRCLPQAEGCPSHNEGWCCSLPQGHTGDHIACSRPLHDLAHWTPVTAAKVSADMLEKGIKL